MSASIQGAIAALARPCQGDNGLAAGQVARLASNGDCDKGTWQVQKQTTPGTLRAGSRCLTSVSEFEVEPGSDDAGIIADKVRRMAEVQVFNAPRHGLVDLAFDTHPADETGVGFRYAYTIP